MLKFLHAEYHILVPTMSYPRVSWQGIGSTGAACPIQVGQCGGSNYSEVKDLKGIFLEFVFVFFSPLFLSQRGWKQLSKKCTNLPTWTQSHRLSQDYVCSVTFPARGSRRVNSNNFIGMTKAQVITGLKEKKIKSPVLHLTSGTNCFVCYLHSIKFTHSSNNS